MTPDARPRPPSPLLKAQEECDWEHAAAFLARRLRRLLPHLEPAGVEDLAQEALLDLIRTSRLEPIRNLNALLNMLARRKAIDWARRRERWGALIVASPEGADAALEDPGMLRSTDPAHRLAFVALEFFSQSDAGCHELAQAFLAGRSWAEVARSSDRGEAAVRKQWSRCVALLRQALEKSPGALWNWAPQGRDSEVD